MATDPEETLEPTGRRYPSTIGGMFFLGLLTLAVAGIVIASAGHWSTGVHCVAIAMVGAAAVRALLPERDAGMLAVRGRVFDACLTGFVGVALWLLAGSLPNA